MAAEDEKNLSENNSGPVYRSQEKFNDPDLLGTTLTRRILPIVTAPARYIGGELGTRREGFADDKANILLAFPDAYEVGMSHQGLRILYHLLMDRPNTFCDLAYTPWPDCEKAMRQEGLPLFGLESRRSAGRFDVVGFSIGYELAYSNMLTMIDLAGSPIFAEDRTEDDPIFIGGGSCTLNPTVMGPFLDVVFIGDGEEAILDVARLTAENKAAGGSRSELVIKLRALPGAWHPGVTGKTPLRVVQDLGLFPPPKQLVPIVEPVHDRLALEVMRGCVRGCRFCQAGMITRPVRERDASDLVEAAVEGIAESGYSEVSLLSLSTSDYSGLNDTVAGIQEKLKDQRTNLVLPSLRVDSVGPELYERISNERPANFTFAPEAGSQRLRDVINKNITEDDIINTARQAFASGVKGVKLYFMMGLPTETNEDLDELIALVGKVVGVAPRGGSQIHVSVSPFSPKSHTPFQWSGQISRDEIDRRNNYLGHRLRRMRVKVSLRAGETSFLEGMLGLGDARLAPVVAEAWRQGARFDGWSEYFDFSRWLKALDDFGIDFDDYLAPKDPESALPWDLIDGGVSKDFLQKDWKRAQRVKTLHDCRLEGACYYCDACEGDIQHVFSQLEAIEKNGPQGSSNVENQELAAAGDSSIEPSGNLFDPRNEDPNNPGKEVKNWTIWRQQAAAKCWYRLEYRKSGDMVFLGHLDFQRQLQLALRRSGLPVAYSRGYHPHPLLKFGPPLPVGVVGMRENFDIAMECQVPGLAEIFSQALPEGLEIIDERVIGGQAPRSIDAIVKRFDYRVEVPGPDFGGPARDTIAAAIDEFIGSKSIMVTRHRPKGDIEVDVRAMVPSGGLALDPKPAKDGSCVLRFSLERSNTGATMPVHDFLAALLGEDLPESRHCLVTRTGYFGRNHHGRLFTPLQEVGETSRHFWLEKHFNG